MSSEFDIAHRVVEKLNDEALEDSELNSCVMVTPFTITSDGGEWFVNFLDQPCLNSDELDRDNLTEASIREQILEEARKLHNAIKKYRLQSEPVKLGAGERKIYVHAEMAVIVRANEGVSIDDVLENAELTLVSQTPGADIEEYDMTKFRVEDSK